MLIAKTAKLIKTAQKISKNKGIISQTLNLIKRILSIDVREAIY